MRTSKIQNDRQGAPKWPKGSEKGSISRFRGAQLSLNKFFDPSSFYEKSRRREKKNKKLMSFLVTTNVVASRPPERRPTGTLHARANYIYVPFFGFVTCLCLASFIKILNRIGLSNSCKVISADGGSIPPPLL